MPGPWAFSAPTGGYQQINGQTSAPGNVISTAGCPTGSVSARQWTVPTYGGTANYVFCYAQYSLSTHFGAYGVSEGSSSVRFINAVILPNSTSWTFAYNSWGDLTSVGLPTGGSISYQWGITTACYTGGTVSTAQARYVSSRTVNDGTNSHTWTYARNGTTQTIVTDPDGNDTVYTHDCAYVSQVDSYQGSHSSGTLLKTVKTTYPPYSGSGNQQWEAPSDNYTGAFTPAYVMPLSVTTILNPGANQVVSKVVNTWDSELPWSFYDEVTQRTWSMNTVLGKKLEQDDYDYGATGSGSPGSLIRSTYTTYAWQSTSPNYTQYLNANLFDTPVSVITKNSGGTKVAEVDYAYDQYSVTASNVTTGFVAAPNGTYRGNRTSVTHWLSTGSSPTAQTCYYDTGNKYEFYDANSVAAGHGCSAGGAFTDQYSYSSTYVGAYLTGTTDALGHTVSAAYDFNSGAMTSFTDQNSKVTTWTYDSLVRPKTEVLPLETQSGTSGEIDITYNETTPPHFTMDVKQRIDSANWKTSTTEFDGLGRIQQTRQTSDPQGTVYVDTAYDNLGRVLSVSNPYRSGYPSCQSGNSESICSVYTLYDALGRKTAELPQDAVIGSFNGIYPVPSSNYVSTSYVGNNVTVTDQSGRTHKTITNALGWLTQVFENPTASSFNGISYPALETDYSYDTLGNLFCVQQKGTAASGTVCPSAPSATNPFSNLSANNYRGRWFVYDSLSRLTDAYNPETQHTSWTYDANGNVKSKTDAKSQIINYSYDLDNRVTGKTYTAGDLAVTYQYDGTNPFSGYTVTNGIHHRTGMIDASGMSAWSYDERGRATSEKRTIGTVTKTASTAYNVMGLPVQLTYANGTVIAYNYDGEGRTASVVDSAHAINYVTGPQTTCAPAVGGLSPACYTASGAISSYLNGYDSSHPTYGVTVTDQYNSRMQPAAITASAASGTILSYTYDFHSGSSNNGDLWALANSLDTTRSKNFSYDAYNRIAQYYTPNSALWNVKYTIDAWGNLTTKAVQSGYGGEGLAAGAATNANQLPGYEYDGGTPSNGNITYDGTNRYTYDSENRISSVTTAGVNYLYDGDGERVQKSNGKSYWGGSNGEPLLETDNSGNALNEYIYFNGRSIARRAISGGAVHYTFSDHLKSATVIADNQGNVQKQYDYAPYGELHWQSGTDPNHYQFAGKELDTESGDSYFGARYFRTNLGRFITPDWSATPAPIPYATVRVPQTLNLYAYVANNPVTGIDPDGHLANGWTLKPLDHSGDVDWVPTATDSVDGSLSEVLYMDYRDLQQGPPAQDQSSAPVATNMSQAISGTSITITRFDPVQYPDGQYGVSISAECASCSAWVQTIRRIGSDDNFGREFVDKGNTTRGATQHYGDNPNPVYGGGKTFSDMPGSNRGNSFKAVVWAGTVDVSNKTFTTQGAFTYGFKVSKGGITVTSPRASTNAERAHSLATIRADSNGWTIK